MVGRARIAAVAAITAVAVLAVAGSTQASLWPLQTVTMTITSQRDQAAPANFAVWPGELVVLKVRNYSHEFHTFTIPALGVSALILPAKGSGPRVTTIRFTAQKHGVVTWLCVICPSGIHGQVHAMNGKIYSMVR
jgi:hypothetical protein